MKDFEVKSLIKEIIVVEGKDDIAAVKKAVDAEIIAVHGFGLNKHSEELIRKAAAKRGVIILTDPDYAGEQIRKRILKIAPNAKHAYIMREEGNKNGNIGVENANEEAILKALQNAHATSENKRVEFTTKDLLENSLMGTDVSKKNREMVCSELSIGYCSARNLLNRLNNYGITREDFTRACEKIEDKNNGK